MRERVNQVGRWWWHSRRGKVTATDAVAAAASPIRPQLSVGIWGESPRSERITNRYMQQGLASVRESVGEGRVLRAVGGHRRTALHRSRGGGMSRSTHARLSPPRTPLASRQAV